MAKKAASMDIQNQEAVPVEETERTHSRRCFVPRSDIYETEDEIIVLADIPGASDKSTDITLEKNVVSISAFVDPTPSSGYELAYAEYEEGDYQRGFRLPDEIDRDKIEATVKDGVLQLRLPKSVSAKGRRIAVSAG
jgi:HSP20 family protein